MEILIIVGSFLLACAFLVGLAYATRKILERIAKYNGYTPDEMPMLYHMFAFGVYFSIVLAIVAVGVYT